MLLSAKPTRVIDTEDSRAGIAPQVKSEPWVVRSSRAGASGFHQVGLVSVQSAVNLV